MIWSWWLAMAGAGAVLGCLGACASQGQRVLIKTLGVPLVLAVSRILRPGLFPVKNTPLYVLIDLIILASAALACDYVVGLRLGRHGFDGYRSDSVGH